MSRRYVKKGDRKPDSFKVGDMFVYENGETALVTEVFDYYNGESRWGPEWTLRLLWTPGRGGVSKYKQEDYNERHGALCVNMFNVLHYASGPWLYPAEEK